MPARAVIIVRFFGGSPLRCISKASSFRPQTQALLARTGLQDVRLCKKKEAVGPLFLGCMRGQLFIVFYGSRPDQYLLKRK